jgi:putative DNA primase/helicase
MKNAPPPKASARGASSSAKSDDDQTVSNLADFVSLSQDRRNPRHAAQDIVPVLSEDHIAREYVDRHEDVIRFDATRQGWFIWEDTRWKPDTKDVAFEWTRNLIRTLGHDQVSGDRRRLGSLKFARGVEGFARTDQRIVVDGNHWDADVDIIGTPSGVVNLKTGETFDPDPNNFITRTVAVDPANATLCPRWFAFLNQITGNDAALKQFLQQWAGYCLTGQTREHKLVFIHGPGGTGKSTFANVLLRIAQDYGVNAAMETFADAKFEQHPEQLARLDGPRLVVASETEAGHRWRENRVKLLTGGDMITARFMRRDSFDFRPRFKLTFLGNHGPAITNLDSAIRRRFVVVPFVNKPAEPDYQLEDALAAEAPGILRWMLNGAVDWYDKGLVLPKAITEATTRYFDDQDMFGQWLDECCDVEPDNRALMERTAALYASWAAWARERGETPGTQTTFNETLRHRGFNPTQIKALNNKGVYGIRLKPVRTWQD